VTLESRQDRVFEFDAFAVDASRRSVTRSGLPVPLTAKAFDTLLFLIENRGRTAAKQEIMDAVWADAAVEENNLTQQISALRKALGETRGEHRFIVTVPGTGYAFVGDIKESARQIRTSRRGYSLAVQAAFASLVLFFSVSIGVLTITAGHSSRPTVAVLPFHSVDGTDDMMGAGMRYTLTAKLGTLHDMIDVRPAGTLPHVDPLVAGRELAVDAVLDGTIQRTGDRVRITVQMVDVPHGRVLWGKSIDASPAESLAAQDAVADEVAVGLKQVYARS
jgi:DNA-binding winged helix-turn-helix (wHTH) protein/TolB-like protein